MKPRKLTTVVATLFVGVTLTFGSTGAAIAAAEKPSDPKGPMFNRPLPPRCYPEYMTTRGDCLVLL